MSWICPRCLQPVFFGEAGTEEGEEKTGRVGAVGFHKYPRRWRNCGSRPLGRRALWRDGAGLPETLPIVSRNPGGWDPGKKGVHLLPGLAPRCLVQPCPPTAEKVSSLGKNWHRFCLKCEHCHNVLSPGGHAEHNGRPYCHKPCYGVLFGPRGKYQPGRGQGTTKPSLCLGAGGSSLTSPLLSAGVNIGGVGSYLYRSPAPIPASITPLSPSSFSSPRPRPGLPQGKKSPPYMKTFTGETSLCPGCEEPVYFAEKVMSLGRNWHRPCLRCQRCRKTLTAGSHAEHDGVPYCHIPCYGYLFGPKGGQPHPRHWA
ncbi:cysteine-rich protein 3 isoform X2 [Sus scrofa]|uniref:cysteine-rich protein 3 isoform X2 n=1 Tax=Sus scrofa TaxID=9823 RepID=UPI000A2B3474|nr:cysteine-rich protein 3 isoform X2 [Sus scrofa]